MVDIREKSDIDRLEQLVNEKFNGALDPAGYEEMHQLLGKSPDLQAAYWSMVSIHVDLHWVIAGRELSSKQPRALFPMDGNSESPARRSPPAPKSHSVHRPWWTLAIAAGLVGVLLAGWNLWSQPADQPGEKLAGQPAHQEPVAPPRANGQPPVEAPRATPGPARLTALADDSHWHVGRPGELNPEHFYYGDTVNVEAGTIEMRLKGDTYGILEAPAVLQLLTDNRVRLLSGHIRVNAPEQEQGFTVETPSAEVVDIGTVFSVEANDTGTDLVVFGGEVDLNLPDSGAEDHAKSAKTMRFTTGEAVHVDRDGTVSRLMSVQSTANPMSPDVPHRSPLIASVVDNNDRQDNWAFYEIVIEGMDEDAPAFVDRFHEWNGVSPQGMPDYLLGGDYVKMFNDDKVRDDLEIQVTLTEPAVLFVMLDHRVDVPEWLTSSFTNTGDVIGMDESPHDTANRYASNKEFAQVGPGESIDETHSIWKKVLPKGGTVVLGPNGHLPSRDPEVTRTRSIQANMYGIVAVPLELE